MAMSLDRRKGQPRSELATTHAMLTSRNANDAMMLLLHGGFAMIEVYHSLADLGPDVYTACSSTQLH